MGIFLGITFLVLILFLGRLVDHSFLFFDSRQQVLSCIDKLFLAGVRPEKLFPYINIKDLFELYTHTTIYDSGENLVEFIAEGEL